MNVASKSVSLSGGVTNGDDGEEIKGTINIAKDKVLTIETVALNNKVGDINVKGELVVNYALKMRALSQMTVLSLVAQLSLILALLRIMLRVLFLLLLLLLMQWYY